MNRGPGLDKDPRPLAVAGLDGWTVSLGAADPSIRPHFTWTDGMGTSSWRIDDNRLMLSSDDIGSALIDLAACRIRLFDVVDPALAEQWVTDQIAPRVLGHLGHLVAHAGAVLEPGGAAILVVAPSGWGKSTLTAFLNGQGWSLLGDDATVLRPDPESVQVRAVWPRLRLRPDSWGHLHPGSPPPRTPTGWKVSVDLGAEGHLREQRKRERPLAAIFCLAAPDAATGLQAERLSASELCMEIVRNSYTLDPADRGRAARRLTLAGRVANAAPGYRLAYPRDFGLLPRVSALIRDVLAGGPAGPSPEREIP